MFAVLRSVFVNVLFVLFSLLFVVPVRPRPRPIRPVRPTRPRGKSCHSFLCPFILSFSLVFLCFVASMPRCLDASLPGCHVKARCLVKHSSPCCLVSSFLRSLVDAFPCCCVLLSPRCLFLPFLSFPCVFPRSLVPLLFLSFHTYILIFSRILGS